MQHNLARANLGSPAPCGRTTEKSKPMPDTNAPLRRDDDEPDDRSVEERMRLALGKLGTVATVGRGGPAGTAAPTRTGAQRRTRFAQNGEVPVERVPPPARLAGEVGRELVEERAARQRAEQALAEAQASVASLQTALARSEQAARMARDTVEEREAAMDGLRAELARGAKREAALTEAAQAEAERKRVEAKLTRVAAPPREPEPVRWWLNYK